jgi:hypothetical protein
MDEMYSPVEISDYFKEKWCVNCPNRKFELCEARYYIECEHIINSLQPECSRCAFPEIDYKKRKAVCNIKNCEYNELYK